MPTDPEALERARQTALDLEGQPFVGDWEGSRDAFAIVDPLTGVVVPGRRFDAD